MKTIAVILAAGQGTRMRSALPKVLHPLLGRPMLQYVVEAASQATNEKPVVVLGHEAEMISSFLGERSEVVLQEPQLGTGHAVQQAGSVLRDRTDFILVLPADLPLVRTETLQQLIRFHRSHTAPVSLITLQAKEPRGFGRIVRDEKGSVKAIVEEAAASPEQLSIRELNAGIYCFTQEWLWQALERIAVSMKGEYYLTDVIGIAATDGLPVFSLVFEEDEEFIGVNNRIHLAQAEAALRRRINEGWMYSGVTVVDPSTTYIEPTVSIGQDTVIWPNTFLQGNTQIGSDCVIGPNTIIRETLVGNGCKVFASVLESAVLEDHVDIGPLWSFTEGRPPGRGRTYGEFWRGKKLFPGERSQNGAFLLYWRCPGWPWGEYWGWYDYMQLWPGW